jgi:organic radical activating enzyme
MEKIMRTKVFWELSNYCTARCSYCPSNFWGGNKPRLYEDYYTAASNIINHYTSIGRSLDWTFTGGEPLEILSLPSILKLCKESQGTTEMTTNGGTLWLDWWAIEPYVDKLHLTYHYWQSSSLIKFIIRAFNGKNKSFHITVPVRPIEFDEDMKRADELEQECGLIVTRAPLYKAADSILGPLDYTILQLERLFGKEWVENRFRQQVKMTYSEKFQEILNANPSYTGKLCNVGIEFIRINHGGWVAGSYCNTAHLGNLWNGTLNLPKGPQPCKMISCINHEDQQITKFD